MADDTGRTVGRVSLRVMPDLREFRSKLKASLNDAVRGIGVEAPVSVDVKRAKADLELLRAQVAGKPVDMGVDADTTKAAEQLAVVARDRTTQIRANVDRNSLASLASMTARLSAVAPLSVAAAGGVASLAGSVASLSGAALVAPGLLTGLGAVIGTIVTATDGMSKAIKGDATALAALPPNARDAATALGSFGKSFQAVRTQVQSNFWAGFNTGFLKLRDDLIPQLQTGMGDLASSLGRNVNDLVSGLRASLSGGALTSIFDNIADGARNGSAAIKPLVDAMTTLVTIGSGQAASAGTWIANLAGKFDHFIQDASNSGALQRWIDTAKTGFHDLGRVITNAGGILSSVVGAASAGGGGLGTLADLLGRIRDVVSSPGFQSALKRIFTAARDGARAISGALPAVGDAIKSLSGPIEDLLRSGGKLFGSLITGAGDLAQGLAPVLSGVTTALSGVVDVLDALPGPVKAIGVAIGGLVVASKLGTLSKIGSVFQAISTKVSTVTGALSGFKGSLGRIGDDAALAGVSRMKVGLGLVGNAASRVGSAATKASDSILKSFGGATMLGIGAGVTVITAAISEFNREVHISDQAVADNKTAIDDLASAYKSAGGAVTDLVRQQAFSDIEKNTPQLVSWAKAQGISMHDLTDAYLGLPSGDAVRSKLSAWGSNLDAEGTNALARTIVGAFVPSAQKAADTSQQWADQISLFLGTAKKATQQNKDMADAVNGTSDKTTKATLAYNAARTALNGQQSAYVDMSGAQANYISQLTQQHNAAIQTIGTTIDLSGVMRSLALIDMARVKKAMQDTGFATVNLNTAANNLLTTMERLAGRDVDVEQATSGFEQALYDMVQQAKDANGQIQQVGTNIVSTAGKINLSTERGRELAQTLGSMSTNAADLATAMAQAANKTGGQNAASKAAYDSTVKSRAEFIKMAAQLGITGKRAQNLADQYGLIPSKVSTTIHATFEDANVKKALNALTRTKIVIPVIGQYSGLGGAPAHSTGLVAHASGGYLDEGLNVIDEQGPELLLKSGNAVRVITAAQSKPILQGAVATGNGTPSRGPLTINNYYPQAEPASVTLMRARALDAALTTVG